MCEVNMNIFKQLEAKFSSDNKLLTGKCLPRAVS